MIKPGAALVSKTDVYDAPFVLTVKDGSAFYELEDGSTGTMTVTEAEENYNLVDQLEQEDVDAAIAVLKAAGVQIPE